MLVEFTVANFRSFRDPVTLSLEPEARLSERDPSVNTRNVADTAFGPLLRVVGVYGANASGKSNLVNAIARLRLMVLNSAREGQAGDPLPAEPFRLDDDHRDAPTELEVVALVDGSQVRYGCAVSRHRVEREWLWVRRPSADEELGFEREGDRYTTGPAWQRDESLERKTRTEALHLSVASSFNHDLATSIVWWFRQLAVEHGLTDRTTFRTSRLLEAGSHAAAIQALVRRLDVSVDDLQLGDGPDVSYVRLFEQLSSGHPDFTPPRRLQIVRRGQTFELSDESAGTIKAVVLAGPIVETLSTGGVLVVDELDARLHTLLSKQIVELFQDPATNPHDAQLIFASHDTNLLTRSLLRRDQLWFVEKSRKTLATDLYSLAELRLEGGKRVRNDASYEADYLDGRYGAIPFFGNLRELLARAMDEES